MKIEKASPNLTHVSGAFLARDHVSYMTYCGVQAGAEAQNKAHFDKSNQYVLAQGRDKVSHIFKTPHEIVSEFFYSQEEIADVNAGEAILSGAREIF